MIPRYQTPEMNQIWSTKNRFETMLKVEKTVAEVQGEMGIIPKAAAQAILERAKFDLEEIEKIEARVRHDVIAFIENVASYVGEFGRFVHYGLTSSDVLDTTLSLQIRHSAATLFVEIQELINAVVEKIQITRGWICVGRTHGMWAEPVSVALKWSSFLAELLRNSNRVRQACRENLVCKLSGAVGTYSQLSPFFEAKVAEKLGLEPELVATQVVPRDRLAQVYWALASLVTGYERIATEIRHLQRSEVGEWREGFQAGQKGSSAMPHKRNPIGSENLIGIARMMRSYVLAGLENVPLWHERDISHSSVERVFLPDAWILSHYATRRLKEIIRSLEIDRDRIQLNLESTRGLLLSSRVLLRLVDCGFSRSQAYEWVQKCSFEALKRGVHLKELLSEIPEVKARVDEQTLFQWFEEEKSLTHENLIVDRVLTQAQSFPLQFEFSST